MESCNYTPIWKHNPSNCPKYSFHQFDPKYCFQQIEPKYCFQQIEPKYCFQQIEPTGKNSDVLNIQWHVFYKSALGYSTLLLNKTLPKPIGQTIVFRINHNRSSNSVVCNFSPSLPPISPSSLVTLPRSLQVSCVEQIGLGL